jgi:hypothetical protein
LRHIFNYHSRLLEFKDNSEIAVCPKFIIVRIRAKSLCSEPPDARVNGRHAYGIYDFSYEGFSIPYSFYRLVRENDITAIRKEQLVVPFDTWR